MKVDTTIHIIKGNTSMLKKYPNPSKYKYMIKSTCPEVTFIGMEGEFKQPDFAEIQIDMVPNKSIIDLKSLKFYLQQFRDKLTSYERLVNIIFENINEVYAPYFLRVKLKTNPRGGIYSELIVDSEQRWNELKGE